jgi:hypothetical protein
VLWGNGLWGWESGVLTTFRPVLAHSQRPGGKRRGPKPISIILAEAFRTSALSVAPYPLRALQPKDVARSVVGIAVFDVLDRCTYVAATMIF